MRGKLIVIKANGERTETDVDGPPIGQKLHAIVGGYFEVVPYFNSISMPGERKRARCVAFCHDEGKLEGLPLNVAATREWRAATTLPIDDVLNGDVAVITGDDELLDAL